MVAAGLLPATVADRHVAEVWAPVLEGLRVHESLVLRDGAEIGWAFRKESPELAVRIDAFLVQKGAGTLLGNVVLKRYLEDTRWVRAGFAEEGRSRLSPLISAFQTYGERYDLDWRLLAAQAYQESGLDPSARSAAGAVGLMQLLPSTAAAPPVSIPDVEQPESNIHAGAKYMRVLLDTYFPEPELSPLDRHLLALAAYNAGPNRIRRLRTLAVERGYDPNVWFGNVELVVGQEVSREPVVYVGNIYKYFLAYDRAAERLRFREELGTAPAAP